jgi:5S rRNA maturation endonuclease (ribonuclease M5)
MEYKYLIIDANNLGYKVLNKSLDRSIVKVSNKFIYKNFIKDYIEHVDYLKKLYSSKEVILLFDNHSSKEELKKAFKSHQGTTRKDIKETYKSNRKRETNEFYESLNFLKYYYMIGDKEYHTVQIFKLEADDLVEPCIKAIVQDQTALLVTNDSDWTRYLSDTIDYLPQHSPCNKDCFFSQYGFFPSEDKVILHKILYGDSADNIAVVFPEFKSELKKKIMDDFDSIFDLILYNSSKDYLKPFTILIKERETELKINYQLLSAIPVTREQFLSHYTVGRGSDRLKNAILDILYDRKENTSSFAFGGIKVPRVNP